jgi:hypothetical protein
VLYVPANAVPWVKTRCLRCGLWALIQRRLRVRGRILPAITAEMYRCVKFQAPVQGTLFQIFCDSRELPPLECHNGKSLSALWRTLPGPSKNLKFILPFRLFLRLKVHVAERPKLEAYQEPLCWGHLPKHLIVSSKQTITNVVVVLEAQKPLRIPNEYASPRVDVLAEAGAWAVCFGEASSHFLLVIHRVRNLPPSN